MNRHPTTAAAMANPPPLTLHDYLALLRRRRYALLLPLLLIAGSASALALLLPPIYRSQATILVERQEIPEALVTTTVTGYVQERIDRLTRRLLTPDRLAQIATEIGYPAPSTSPLPQGDITTTIRQGIVIELLDVRTHSRSGSESSATVAFTVSFEAPTARLAQRGADAVAQLYLDEERRARQLQVQEVTRFLTLQREQQAAEIATLERRLAAFKQRHVNQLPELADLNLRLFEQSDEKLERSYEQLRLLQQRQLNLRTELTLTRASAPLYDDEGSRVMQPAERLAVLRSDYLRNAARYGSDHPDRQQLQREIALLAQQLGASDAVAAAHFHDLEREQAALFAAQQRYSREHPDVVRLQQRVAELQLALQQAQQQMLQVATPPSTTAIASPVVADNPDYIRLRSELDGVDLAIEAELQKQAQLQQKRQQLEQRLLATPLVERDYRQLARDYDQAVTTYQETQQKLLQAQSAEQLEATGRGQQFTLTESASHPTTPERPNRLGIALLGMVLAIGGGLGGVTLAELLDRSLRGSRDIVMLFGAPPIATIPLIRRHHSAPYRRWRWSAALLLVSLLAAVGWWFH